MARNQERGLRKLFTTCHAGAGLLQHVWNLKETPCALSIMSEKRQCYSKSQDKELLGQDEGGGYFIPVLRRSMGTLGA